MIRSAIPTRRDYRGLPVESWSSRFSVFGVRDSLKAGLQQPDKLETYHRLTAAINRAKDAGDIQTLREIADDPHGFILRQGWARPVR